MTGYLPPGLKELFAPREPLPYTKPLDRDPRARRGPRVTGISQYVGLFEDPTIAASLPKPETLEQRRERVRAERQVRAHAHERSMSRSSTLTATARTLPDGLTRTQAQAEAKRAEETKSWDPRQDPNVTGDEYKTLFIGHLSYEATERRLLARAAALRPVCRWPGRGCCR